MEMALQVVFHDTGARIAHRSADTQIATGMCGSAEAAKDTECRGRGGSVADVAPERAPLPEPIRLPAAQDRNRSAGIPEQARTAYTASREMRTTRSACNDETTLEPSRISTCLHTLVRNWKPWFSAGWKRIVT